MPTDELKSVIINLKGEKDSEAEVHHRKRKRKCLKQAPVEFKLMEEEKTAGEVQRGDIVIIDGVEHELIDFSTSKTGKHGAAKKLMRFIDRTTGK